MSEFRMTGIKGYGQALERQLLSKDSQKAESAGSLSEISGNKGTGGAAQSGSSFLDSLKGAMTEANDMQKSADAAAKNFAAGKGSLHETMIAMEKADLSLRAITSVRGKLIEAYQEIMRMPV